MGANPTRNPFVDPDAPTLRDVLHRLDQAADLTPTRQSEITSAINTAARWLHRAPEEIPASHEYLRRAFERLSPITLNVGKPRFDNVRSLVKKGLRVTGVKTSGQTYLVALTPVWRRLAERIADPYARQCLGRLMRYAGTQGMAPEQVDDAFVRCFLQALTDEDLTSRPAVAVQSAVRLWNRMSTEIPGWPGSPLTALLRREIYTLSWDCLPPDFVADVDHYLSIVGGADPTDPLAPPRPLKPQSIRTRQYQIQQPVSGFVHQGGNIDDLHCLADLCQVDRVRMALRFFIDRHRRRHGENAESATSMIGGIADAIRVIAKHHVNAPVSCVTELTRIANRLKPRRTGLAEKNRLKLRQIDSPEVRRKLLLYPQEQMRKLAAVAKPSRTEAVRYSVLMAIEILILAPMRVSNLAMLDLDQHFGWPDRADQDIGLTIPRGAVKNWQQLDYKIPASSSIYLRIYLERFRLLLCCG